MKTRYDLAIENARESIEELRLAAYEQGYKDAMKDLTAKSPVRFAERYTGIQFREYQEATAGRMKSPQLRRDEIIEKAKRDVAELLNEYQLSEKEAEFSRKDCSVVFIIRHLFSGMVLTEGIAKCDPSDCFNVHIGKAIALRRALGLEVPSEYLNAPQPTEVRVGDVVESNLKCIGGYFDEVLIRKVVPDFSVFDPYNTCAISSPIAKHGKIIDDSRNEVAE